jgi:hypothetical protein
MDRRAAADASGTDTKNFLTAKKITDHKDVKKAMRGEKVTGWGGEWLINDLLSRQYFSIEFSFSAYKNSATCYLKPGRKLVAHVHRNNAGQQGEGELLRELTEEFYIPTFDGTPERIDDVHRKILTLNTAVDLAFSAPPSQVVETEKVAAFSEGIAQSAGEKLRPSKRDRDAAIPAIPPENLINVKANDIFVDTVEESEIDDRKRAKIKPILCSSNTIDLT